MPAKMLNVSHRKVGGIRFIKVGRFNVSWSVSKTYKELLPPAKVELAPYWVGPEGLCVDERFERALRADA
jgi:hypothetical protein